MSKLNKITTLLLKLKVFRFYYYNSDGYLREPARILKILTNEEVRITLDCLLTTVDYKIGLSRVDDIIKAYEQNYDVAYQAFKKGDWCDVLEYVIKHHGCSGYALRSLANPRSNFYLRLRWHLKDRADIILPLPDAMLVRMYAAGLAKK